MTGAAAGSIRGSPAAPVLLPPRRWARVVGMSSRHPLRPAGQSGPAASPSGGRPAAQTLAGQGIAARRRTVRGDFSRGPGVRPSRPSERPVSPRAWRLGVAGLGVVGAELVRLVAERPDYPPSGDRVEVRAVSARRRDPAREGGAVWVDDPVALAAFARHRRVRGADRRGRGAGAGGGGGGAGRRQARGHRQQGADRHPRRAPGRPGRAARGGADVRGGGDGGRARREAGARGGGRLPHPADRRHPQRHLQLHPHRDGGLGPGLPRGAGRGPGAGLRRGRPHHRRRRLRRGPQDRRAGRPGLRRRAQPAEAVEVAGHRGACSCSTSGWPPPWATASS